MKNGLFITFEGIDGCGKSTQIAKTAQFLEEKKVPYLVTREPGGTSLAEEIREIILSPKNSDMTDSCEVLLYLAARAQHVTEKILPALKEGRVVLCDRFQEATFAYQGFGRGFPLHLLQQINTFATSGLVPTKTFIFDISVDCAFERMRKMNKVPDRLESNSKEFYQKIREGYLSLASAHPSRIMLLLGDRPIEKILEEVLFEVNLLLDNE